MSKVLTDHLRWEYRILQQPAFDLRVHEGSLLFGFESDSLDQLRIAGE